LDKANKLSTKVVTISPRFIFLNKTSFDVELTQPGLSLEEAMIIEKGIRKPKVRFMFDPHGDRKDSKEKKKKLAKNINLRPYKEEAEEWCWSGDLSILDLNTNHFMIQKQESANEVKYLKTSVTKHQASIFVVLEEEEIAQIPYRIENLCQEGVDISVYQSGSHPSRGLIVKTGENVPWSWRFPNNKKELTADFITEGSVKHHLDKYKFTFNNLHEPITGEICIGNEQKTKITAETIIENGIRILRFTDESSVVQDLEQECIPTVNYDIQVNLEKIALAVTAAVEDKENGTKERQEIMYSKFAGVKVTLVETDEKRFCRLAFRSLSLRDNLTHQCTFMKAFAPTYEEMFSKDSRKQFLDILLVQRYNIQMPYLETVQVFLDQANVNLDSHFVQNLCKTFQNIQKSLSLQDDNQVIGSLVIDDRQREDDSYPQEAPQEWKIVPLGKSPEEIFIKDFVIQPLSLHVSLKMNAQDFITEDFSFIKRLLYKLGAGLAKLNNVPISAEKTHMTNVFGSTDNILDILVENYTQNLSKAAFKWAASFGIVPSSTGLLESLCPGILKMFWFPSLGLFGPQNVARFAGYVSSRRSSASAIGGTPRGSFASYSQINNTVVDEKKKIYQGMIVFAHEHSQKEFPTKTKDLKVKGMMLNVSQNPSKPVVTKLNGALDSIEDETEKLLVRSNLMRYKDKSHEYKIRMLDPVDQEEEKYDTSSIEGRSGEGYLVIYDMNIHTTKDLGMIGAYCVVGENESAMILVCAHEIILAWGLKKEKILWSFEPKDLEVVEITSRGLQVGLKRAVGNNIKDKALYISNYDSAQNEVVGKVLKNLKNNLDESSL